MTGTKAEFELSKITSKETRHTWIKPVFDFEDLCCEVTMYLYNRR